MSTCLEDLSAIMLPEIENELHRCLESIDRRRADSLYAMLAYHLGWEGQEGAQKPSGKRIRPLLLLLVSSACGGDWRIALPAAASIELVHNFSLIHDDIEDNDHTRRGRPTLWKKWGLPLALNAGDSMFALAHLALYGLKSNVSAEMMIKVTHLLQQTCLRLTEGQHLDISYAERTDLEIEDYWPMVNAKTAALIAASTEIGALLGGANQKRQKIYRDFGEKLGLAFQVLDDFLGVWGDPHITGKSAASDLSEGKKSLPVLYGLSKKAEFTRRWREGTSSTGDVSLLANLLADEGARTYTLEASARLTGEALAALSAAAPQGEAGKALGELSKHLLSRNQ